MLIVIYAEYLFKFSVIDKPFIITAAMLNVVMLNVVMLNVVMLSVIMLNVVAQYDLTGGD
jgi:hypothetical protein